MFIGHASGLLGVGHLYSLGENKKMTIARPQILKINKQDLESGSWTISLDMLPGKYSYKYFVDDSWRHDPGQPTTPDNFGGLNNTINISGLLESKISYTNGVIISPSSLRSSRSSSPHYGTVAVDDRNKSRRRDSDYAVFNDSINMSRSSSNSNSRSPQSPPYEDVAYGNKSHSNPFETESPYENKSRCESREKSLASLDENKSRCESREKSLASLDEIRRYGSLVSLDEIRRYGVIGNESRRDGVVENESHYEINSRRKSLVEPCGACVEWLVGFQNVFENRDKAGLNTYMANKCNVHPEKPLTAFGIVDQNQLCLENPCGLKCPVSCDKIHLGTFNYVTDMWETNPSQDSPLSSRHSPESIPIPGEMTRRRSSDDPSNHCYVPNLEDSGFPFASKK